MSKELVEIPLPAPMALAGSKPGRLKASVTNAADGTSLFCRTWQGDSSCPAIIYLHGIEGHGQWFEQTASYLNRVGFTVYAPDRRGSGRNAGVRGDIASYRQFLDDLKALLATVRKQQPDVPLILMGSCWGAKLAVAVLQEPEVDKMVVSGLVLITPAIKTLVDVDLITKIKIGWSWLTGSKRRFKLPIEVDMFTDNPIYKEFIERDPLRLTEVSASFLIESLKVSKLALEAGARLQLPVLVLAAGRDRIVDVAGLEDWFERIPTADKEMYVFSWSEHCLDFDEHVQEYARCLSKWLLALGKESKQ
jgi:lysophospholipase